MRFESYSQRDTPDTGSIDPGWTGIDMTRDRPLVAPGMLTRGENTRLEKGTVAQRAGTVYPSDFNPAFETELIGSGVYRNPNSDEVLLVAPKNVNHVWAIQSGKDPVQVNINAADPLNALGSTGSGLVRFVQAFDKVVLLRVPGIQSAINLPPLVWTGVPAATFDVMTLSAEGNTVIPTPNPWNGEPVQDRIAYYNDNFNTVTGTINRDSWIISDIEDYTSYDPSFQLFRTNSAESDYITRIMTYFRDSVLVMKHQSIHMATLLPVFPVAIQQRVLNSRLGSIGNRMPLMIGGDVIFLSEPNGFYRLSEVIQDNITTQPVPISEPIQSVIDSINWPVTRIWGCAVALGRYSFHGVCLGVGFLRLNAVLVYDTQTRKYVSAGDSWRDANFAFNALHVTNYQGVSRVFAIDYVDRTVYLLYEGLNDNLKTGEWSVPFKMETRGYYGDDPQRFKRFGRATISISTYAPSIKVTALMDGFNEEKLLTIAPLTKDRTAFYQHGHLPFDPLTSDPMEMKREDYSIVEIDNFAAEDFEGYPVGPIFFVSGTSPGILTGERQQSVEPFIVRSFGRWCALRVENDQGYCEVTSAGVESTRAVNTNRTAA